MATTTPDEVAPRPRRSRRAAFRGAAGTAGAAVMGAAPHVLHHVGPLAGAALLAGATGTILFGVLGLLLAIPFLRRVRRHTGGWRIPATLLAAMAGMFTLSTLVIGPALAGDGDDAPAQSAPGRPPAGGDDAEHDIHHP